MEKEEIRNLPSDEISRWLLKHAGEEIDPGLARELALSDDRLLVYDLTGCVLPVATQLVIAGGRHAAAQMRLTETPHTSPVALRVLAGCRDAEVRARLAHRRDLEPALVDVLAQDGHEEVREALATNPLAGRHMPGFVRAGGKVHQASSQNPVLGRDAQEQRALDPTHWVNLARNRSLDAGLARAISADTGTHPALAGNPATPGDVLDVVAGTVGGRALVRLAARVDLSRSARECIIARGDKDALEEVATNPALDLDLLRDLAAKGVRSVVSNPKLPPEALRDCLVNMGAPWFPGARAAMVPELGPESVRVLVEVVGRFGRVAQGVVKTHPWILEDLDPLPVAFLRRGAPEVLEAELEGLDPSTRGTLEPDWAGTLAELKTACAVLGAR